MARTVNNENKKPVSISEKFIFRLGLADVLRLTMFGTLISITKDITRIPLHLPGHTSIYWMGILVLGKGLVPKFGAGMVMGAVSGILAVLLGLGKEGVFVFFKYFVPGLLLDILSPLFYNKLENPFVGAICGMLTSLSKLLVNLVLGILLKFPMSFIALGLGFASVSHTLFGAAGGLIASVLIKRLKPRLPSWE